MRQYLHYYNMRDGLSDRLRRHDLFHPGLVMLVGYVDDDDDFTTGNDNDRATYNLSDQLYQWHDHGDFNYHA